MRHFFGSVFVQEDDHIELSIHSRKRRFLWYRDQVQQTNPQRLRVLQQTSTTNYDEIVNFTQCLMENSAYPENLPEYVEDYLYEKEPTN